MGALLGSSRSSGCTGLFAFIGGWTMATLEYSRYLQSAHWKRLRAKVIKAAGGRCITCGTDAHITVHHLTYARLGHEEPEDLQVLCRTCHGTLHGRRSTEERLQGSEDWQELRELVPDLALLEMDCFRFWKGARRVAKAGYDHTKAEAAYSLCLSAWYGQHRCCDGLCTPPTSFKEQLTALVGWHAEHHPAGIAKRPAYNVAYKHLFYEVLGL